MTSATPATGELIYSGSPKPGLLFEVYASSMAGPDAYVGYCNGERSVSAHMPDACVRGLQKKHLSEDYVISLEDARRRLR